MGNAEYMGIHCSMPPDGPMNYVCLIGGRLAPLALSQVMFFCAYVTVTSKKARRRKQNRVAAKTSREKKQKYLTNLEQRVHTLNQQNENLLAKLREVQNENKRLLANTQPEQTNPIVHVEATTEATAVELVEGNPDCSLPVDTFESPVFSYPQQSEEMQLHCRNPSSDFHSIIDTPLLFPSRTPYDNYLCVWRRPTV